MINQKFLLLTSFIFVLTLSSVAAIPVLLSDQGTDAKSSGATLSSGDLTILIYSASTGGTPIFNQTFTGAIINGSWNLMINPDLEFGKNYFKDYSINGIDLDFSGSERLEFTSPIGLINNASFVNFSLINTCPLGQAIRQVNSDGSVVCETVSGNITNTDTQWNIAESNYLVNASGVLNINESKLNQTIDARIPSIGYQSSAAGWVNDSLQTNTSLNVNVLSGKNITTTGTGFFGYLGSLVNRITKLFATDIDVSNDVIVGRNVNASGNVTGSQLCIGNDCKNVWPFGSSGVNDTIWNIAGSNYLYNNSGILDINETKLNATIELSNSMKIYTHLSNFTDDLGSRGYTILSNFTDDLGNRGFTSLSNFTNNMGFLNSSQAQAYNDTILVISINKTSNIMSLGFYNKSEIDNLISSIGGGNSSFNQSLTDALYYSISNPLNFINATTGQVFNDTTLVLTVNSSLWSYINTNEASWLSVYNATYSNILNQNCPAGQVVNGTLANGTFICMTLTAVETEPAWNGNYSTFTGLINNASYLSTYNSTYDAKAGTGNCPAGQVVVNTTSSGVQCIIPPAGAESDPIFTAENASLWAEAKNKYNSTYAQFAYNQTAPANSYTDSVNASQSSWIESVFAKIVDVFTKSEIKEQYYNKTNVYNKSEVDSLITVTDLSNYYNKSQVDTNLSYYLLLADQRYNETSYIDNNLNNYYSKLEVYNKTEVNNLIPNVSDYYTKVEVDNNLTFFLLKTDQSFNETTLINNLINSVNTTANIKSLGFYNSSEIDGLIAGVSGGNSSFNQSLTDSLYLNKNDQRYNDTDYIKNNFYTISQVYNKTEIINFGFINSTQAQAYNETTLINSLNASKLDTADQRYNDTALINAVNTTANINSLGFLNKSGTNANQNINVNPYNITASRFIGDGSLLTNLPSGQLYTHLSNFTDDLGNRGYTYLSNFTDNLGNRGYTSLSNFTNDLGFINSTSLQAYNETALINSVNMSLSSRIDNISGSNSSFNQTLTDSLYAGKIWNYNQTAPAIDYASTNFIIKGTNNAWQIAGENITSGTIGFARLPPLIDSHTLKYQNITNIPTCSGTDKLTFSGGVLSCAADQSGSGGDGTGGWTNTSTQTSTSLNLAVNNSVLFVNATSGRIGIGTSSPNQALNVVGNTNVTGNVTASKFIGDGSLLTNLPVSGGGGWTDDGANVRLTTSGDSVVVGHNTVIPGGAPGAPIWPRLSVLGGATQISIYAFAGDTSTASLVLGKSKDGSVGNFGYPPSSEQLGVIGFAGADSSQFKSGATIQAFATEAWSSTAHGTKIVFQTTANGATANSDRITIEQNGNIGIGANNQAEKLYVAGDAKATGNVTAAYFKGDGSQLTGIASGSGDGTGGWINSSTITSTNLNVNITSGNLTVYSGKVGIGTASPNQALHVVGNANITGNVTASKFIGDGSLLTGISPSADGTGGWTNTSSTTSTGLNVNITGNVTALRFIGDGSLLTNLPSGQVYTHLSNFTDNLGNRGYTSLSNFTNDVGYITTDTNETTRFNALTSVDCPSGSLVIGIQGNGTVLCATDQTGGGTADGTGGWTNTSTVTSTSLRVGIGTSNPTESFQTNNIIQTARFSSGWGSSSTSNVAYWGLEDDSNNGGQTKGFVWRIDKPSDVNSHSNLILRLVQGFSNSCSGYPHCNLSAINGNGVDAVTFAGNGRVGIGTTSPNEKLEVNGNIRINRGSTVAPSSGHSNTGTTYTGFGSMTGGALTGMEVVTTWDGSTNDEEIVFKTHNGGVSAGERLKIDKDGKLTGEGSDLIIMRSYGWASGDFGNDLDTGISATTYSAVNLVSWDAANADDWSRFDVGGDGDWHLMSYGGRAQIVFYHKSIATRDLSG